jgi:signal peptidase I
MSVEAVLRELHEAGAPSVTPPPFLAERVIARRKQVRRRGRVITAALAVAVVAGTAAARQGGGRFFAEYEPSGSMLPTVEIGGSVVADRSLTPVDQDVVVVKVHRPEGEVVSIRRVMALGGETIACPDSGDGKCHAWVRNGQTLDEPYVEGLVRAPVAPVTVPAGQMYLLGDARDNAVDSSFTWYGTVPVANVQGVVVEVVTAHGERRAVPGAPPHERPKNPTEVDPHQGPPPAVATTP